MGLSFRRKILNSKGEVQELFIIEQVLKESVIFTLNRERISARNGRSRYN
jgi:hypothetical protein